MARNPSDVHLRPGTPPILRVHNRLLSFEEWPPLSVDDLEDLGRRLVSPERFARLASAGGVNVPLTLAEKVLAAYEAGCQTGKLPSAMGAGLAPSISAIQMLPAPAKASCWPDGATVTYETGTMGISLLSSVVVSTIQTPFSPAPNMPW